MIVFSVAMVGCSSPTAAPETDTGAPMLADPRGLALPVQAYRLTAEQRAVVDRAHAQLVGECMRRAGFTTAPAHARPSFDPMSRRYGVTDPATAKRLGYHLEPDQLVVNHADKGPRPSPAEMRALTGNTDGRQLPPGRAGDTGCLGSASDALGIDGTEETLADQIDFDGFARSKSDPRVIEVFARWSRCMTERGYAYTTPLAVAADFDITATVISPAEIETALADVACKAATDVVGVWYSVECDYENSMIERARPALTAIQERNTVIVDNAVHVLG
ncbi:hypothetical protein [Actinophytocola sp.]|uniref:hypothetical protein n=1 Tax=Actinophytocola sp. TaxID=1872138 RepID=UPI002D3A3697|nr:hypothetical protein [Actinophytocola sp.]HYQ68756.1 hypothetical protein [Actinophytocola sp.]